MAPKTNYVPARVTAVPTTETIPVLVFGNQNQLRLQIGTYTYRFRRDDALDLIEIMQRTLNPPTVSQLMDELDFEEIATPIAEKEEVPHE